jgi:hypothetical protein
VLSWSRATRDLLKSFGWGIRALHQLATATMVPFPRRLPHTISPLEGGGFELSVPRQRLHGRDQFEPPDPHQEVASDSLLPSVKAPAVCRAYHQILRGQSSRHKKSGPS